MATAARVVAKVNTEWGAGRAELAVKTIVLWRVDRSIHWIVPDACRLLRMGDVILV